FLAKPPLLDVGEDLAFFLARVIRLVVVSFRQAAPAGAICRGDLPIATSSIRIVNHALPVPGILCVQGC
ncbi:MAG: hypothetical protein ACO39C_10315, partial [Chthoniobacterales bacterium]